MRNRRNPTRSFRRQSRSGELPAAIQLHPGCRSPSRAAQRPGPAQSAAVRVSELVKIKVGEVDLGSCKAFIDQGKGAKDRYILFPASFRLVLKSHLQANPKNRYLFETSRCGPFTPRRIQQIVQSYRAQAGLTQPVHPHLFRHQMITYLTSQGLSDAQIQLISGHESKKSLEIYQHLSLGAVEQAYQEAVQGVSV